MNFFSFFCFRNLQESKEYTFRCRGEIDVKGKGKMVTYFLLGTDSKCVEEPDDEFQDLPVLGNKDNISLISAKSKSVSSGKHSSITCVIL